MQQFRRLLKGGVYAAAFIFVVATVSTAQTRSATTAHVTEQATLQALLEEMRLLRREIHKANLQTYHTQLILQRMRIRQEHTDRLSRQLDAVRSELDDMRQARLQFSERIKEAEEKVNLETNEEDRAQGRRQLRELQLELKQQQEREQTRIERESQLVTEIQSEQSKLTELNNRLVVLESEMTNLTPQAQKPLKRRQ